MKILFLTFYFEPDLCAGSFRATAITRALLQADPAVELEVLTTQPNRYGSFLASALPSESTGRLSVQRFELPAHKSGMRDQARAFGSYARQVLAHVRRRQYDAVLATSSRLMTASLAALISRWQRLPLYLDVRDIFVDTMGDVLPASAARCATAPFSAIERWTMSRARRINLVSEGFREYFASRYPTVRLSFFTNGIDDEFVELDRGDHPRAEGARTRVLYAGNIGEGQGLHLIVPPLARRLPSFDFIVVGDGGRADALRQEVDRSRLTNVYMKLPMKRTALVEESLLADILFLHLNDYPAFRKVLPSKLFEYAALGKPVWAGVAGHAADFVQREIDNAAVFDPCDVEGALRALATLRIEATPRPAFVERYRRAAITQRLAADVLDALAAG